MRRRPVLLLLQQTMRHNVTIGVYWLLLSTANIPLNVLKVGACGLKIEIALSPAVLQSPQNETSFHRSAFVTSHRCDVGGCPETAASHKPATTFSFSTRRMTYCAQTSLLLQQYVTAMMTRRRRRTHLISECSNSLMGLSKRPKPDIITRRHLRAKDSAATDVINDTGEK